MALSDPVCFDYIDDVIQNAGEMGRNLTAHRLLNAHILGVGKDATCKRSEGVTLPNPCQLLQFITDILGLVASQ